MILKIEVIKQESVRVGNRIDFELHFKRTIILEEGETSKDIILKLLEAGLEDPNYRNDISEL